MPLLGFNPTDYFSSLKDTSTVASDIGFSMADVSYSPTNAATIPTVTVASPFSDLKQWSLDTQGEYEKAQVASTAQSNQKIGQYLLVAGLGLALVMALKR
jgi:hypothetical protein